MIRKITLFLLFFSIHCIEIYAQVFDVQKSVTSTNCNHKCIDFKDSLISIFKDSSINEVYKNKLKILDVRSVRFDSINTNGDFIFEGNSILTKSGAIITVDCNDFTEFSKSSFSIIQPENATEVQKSLSLPKPVSISSYKEDADGNIYLVGNFESESKIDAYISKYNSKLQLVGFKEYSNCIFLGFTIDSNGDFFISGQDSSIFCMKIDVEFKTIWKKNIHLPITGRQLAHSEIIATKSKLYFTVDKSEPFIDMLLLNNHIVCLDANSGKLIYNREILHDVCPREFIKLFVDDDSNVHLSFYSGSNVFLQKLEQRESSPVKDTLANFCMYDLILKENGKIKNIQQFSSRKDMCLDFMKITHNNMFLKVYDNHRPVLVIRDIISGNMKFYNAYLGAYSVGSNFKIISNSDNTQFYMFYQHCYDAKLTDMSIINPKYQYYLLKLNLDTFMK